MLCSCAGSSLVGVKGQETWCWDGARRRRKLGFILHYHNRISAANKAGISAPTVAFGEDPSLFPLQAGPRHLKKKKIYSLFPLSWALPDCNKGLNGHTCTQTCTNTHSMPLAHACVCDVRLHVRTDGRPVPQRSAGSLTCPSEGITST